MTTSADSKRVLRALRRYGLLLEADADLPSVGGLVAGRAIRGSWWGHPAGHAIFAVCELLHARDDVLATKLIHGKVTYVDERLWPAHLGVATSNRAWQRRALSVEARSLLARVRRRGLLRLDAVPQPARALRLPVRELESRLLVHSASVHSERGKHVKQLQSWRSWMQREAWTGPPAGWNVAVHAFEEAARQLESGAARAQVRFPWQD